MIVKYVKATENDANIVFFSLTLLSNHSYLIANDAKTDESCVTTHLIIYECQDNCHIANDAKDVITHLIS